MAPASRGRALSRLWPNDEEMAKKDDDHVLASRGARSSGGAPWQAASRVPRRRFIGRLAAYIFVVFLFIVGVSRLFAAGGRGPNEDDLVGGISRFDMPSVQRPPVQPPDGSGVLDAAGEGVDLGKDRTAEDPVSVQTVRTFSGPVKLPYLGKTLHAISKTMGGQVKNRNVLFAAAGLPSAATILPMACQMAMERQNYVHFAFFGRSDIPLQDLLAINGIDADCQLILHDARPDFLDTSTEQRMMISTARAFYHIHTYMHPQAILIDSSTAEENYFLFGTRDQVKSMMSVLIELPPRPGQRFSWITKLDSASLQAWDKVHVDIAIHAPSGGSGNLNRLLKSLAEADLGAMSIPHITIELPNAIDAHLEKALSNFHWPPVSRIDPAAHPNMLSLRHRLSRQKLTEEESTVRFLESFWPTNRLHSHVLVMSPNTEVGPQFFHYLKYTLLHHRYSNAAMIQDWNSKMMGISFASPTTLLDGTQPLTPPPPSEDLTALGNHFLWQAPNSDATIFPADKWVELHAFVTNILEMEYTSGSTPALLARKDVSKKHPAWLEHVLQLSRLRGYFTVYPGQDTANAIMGIHNDAPFVPDEYQGDEEAEHDASGDTIEDQATAVFDATSHIDILSTLPQSGNLPNIHNLPVLTWDGKTSSVEDLETDADEYVVLFRRDVGQCDGKTPKPPPHKLTNDLFCKPKPSM